MSVFAELLLIVAAVILAQTMDISHYKNVLYGIFILVMVIILRLMTEEYKPR